MKSRMVVSSAMISILAVISVLVSGCASTYYESHKPREFTKVSNPKSFSVGQIVTSERKAGSLGDVDSTQGILPGTYVSVLENHEGTLFFGSGRSYFVKYANKPGYYLRPGGFWIPKAKGAATKLFYIVDTNQVLVASSLEGALKGNTTAEEVRKDISVVLSAFIESEEGHIVLVPTEAGFTKKLSSQLQPT